MSNVVCPAALTRALTEAAPAGGPGPQPAAAAPRSPQVRTPAAGGTPERGRVLLDALELGLSPASVDRAAGADASFRPATPGAARLVARTDFAAHSPRPTPPASPAGVHLAVDAPQDRRAAGRTPTRTPASSRAASPAGSGASSTSTRPDLSPFGTALPAAGALRAWAGAGAPLAPVRLGPGGWRRPGMARLGSTASAIVQVIPSAPQPVYDAVAAEMARALRDARATGGLSFLVRKLGASRLHAVARKLAGPEAVGLSLEQIHGVVAALARPRAFSPSSIPQDQAVLAGGPAAQPSVKPLLWCSDELLLQAHRLCDVTLAVERDETLILLLRRSAAALSAAGEALETYQYYTHTGGHRHIGEYRRLLRERIGWLEERQRCLLQKERSDPPQ